VTTIRIASEVGVVLEKMDGAANSLFMKSILGTNQQVLKNAFARLILRDNVAYRIALGRCIFGMRTDV
jgi:hypothetical protein